MHWVRLVGSTVELASNCRYAPLNEVNCHVNCLRTISPRCSSSWGLWIVAPTSDMTNEQTMRKSIRYALEKRTVQPTPITYLRSFGCGCQPTSLCFLFFVSYFFPHRGFSWGDDILEAPPYSRSLLYTFFTTTHIAEAWVLFYDYFQAASSWACKVNPSWVVYCTRYCITSLQCSYNPIDSRQANVSASFNVLTNIQNCLCYSHRTNLYLDVCPRI